MCNRWNETGRRRDGGKSFDPDPSQSAEQHLVARRERTEYFGHFGEQRLHFGVGHGSERSASYWKSGALYRAQFGFSASGMTTGTGLRAFSARSSPSRERASTLWRLRCHCNLGEPCVTTAKTTFDQKMFSPCHLGIWLEGAA